MDRNRAAWNNQQQQLQAALVKPGENPEYLSLFLNQHAQVHAGKMSEAGLWSFEDEALDGMDDDSLRAIPAEGEHSVAWILWHLARIEDVTMNMLVAGKEQLFARENWREKINSSITDTGNSIEIEKVASLSHHANLEMLKAYRVAVGKCTRSIASQLPPGVLNQKVEAERLNKLRNSGEVMDQAVIDYWSRRTIAGMLLMPPTRHCFIHLNEILRIKQALHIK